MNGICKIPTRVLLTFILSCVSFSLLLPSLIISISQQIESSARVQYLNAEIYDLQKYQTENAYHPSAEVKAPIKQTVLSTLKAEYSQLRLSNVISIIITAVETFFTWLVIVLATRIFNDYFYPPLHVWAQRRWERVNKKITDE